MDPSLTWIDSGQVVTGMVKMDVDSKTLPLQIFNRDKLSTGSIGYRKWFCGERFPGVEA